MIHIAIWAGAHLVQIGIAAGVAAVVTAAAIVLWHKILGMAQSNILPWVDEHMPSLAPTVRLAFSFVDKVATAVRLEVKAAWEGLRKVLLKQVARFEQHANHSWQVEVISWLRSGLTNLDPQRGVTEIRTVKQLSFDEVPFEIREQAYRLGQGPYQIDITQEREAELALQLAS
jgi:hypothetical protein